MQFCVHHFKVELFNQASNQHILFLLFIVSNGSFDVCRMFHTSISWWQVRVEKKFINFKVIYIKHFLYRLRDQVATCPNCRVEISKSNASRNLAVEKAVSELPSECQVNFRMCYNYFNMLKLYDLDVVLRQRVSK